jgi:hypothetical protein
LGHNPKSATDHTLVYCPYDARRYGWEKKSSTLPSSNEMVARQYPVGSASDCRNYGFLTASMISF